MERKLKRIILSVIFGASFVGISPHPARAASPQTVLHDVAFKVGTDATIVWFEIDNPSVRGTISVTGAPYSNTASLNAAAVDGSRNRLIFDDYSNTNNVHGYAINNLSGLQLIQNGTTVVTVSSLGSWPGGGDNAGYRTADGQLYYRVDGSDEIRYLTFNAAGSITGYTSVGNFSGSGLTPTMTGGDVDFDANGSLWITGGNNLGIPRLWNFNPTTLQLISATNTNDLYGGMTFDATGTRMYGYDTTIFGYGSINTSTGAFSLIATDPTTFGDSGDLAQAIETIVTVPEPTVSTIMSAILVITICRRTRTVTVYNRS